MSNNDIVVYTQHNNFSYKELNDKICDTDLNSSLFNSTKITNSEITMCNLEFTEWQGTQINKSKISNSSLKYADIKSIYCTNTIFENTNFDYVNIKDSIFKGCSFINCTFNGANMLENNFLDCTFEKLRFDSMYAFLNVFKNTNFISISFGGSFYFSCLEKCSFINQCVIDSYLLGYFYGLNSCMLDNVLYILKNDATFNQEQAINYANNMYSERFMLMNIGFLSLLNNIDNLEFNIAGCISYLNKSIKNNIIIKNEEITFLNYIIKAEYENHRISAYSLYQFYELLSQINIDNNNALIEKSKDQINILKNYTYLTTLEYMNNIKLLQPGDMLRYDKAEIFLKYNEKPKVEMVNILNEFIGKNEEPAYLIKSEKGSYIEWISCIPRILPYFQLFIDCLGIITPIIIYVKENKKKTEKIETKEAKQEISVVEPFTNLELTIKNFNDSQKTLDPVIKVIKKENLKIDNNYNGYTKTNVVEIKIELKTQVTHI